VFWRYTAPILFAYALAVPLWLGGNAELLQHAIAGLVAWLLVRFFSHAPSREEASATVSSVETLSVLGLLDEPGGQASAGATLVRDRQVRGREDERPPLPSAAKSDASRLPPGLLDW
jgi:hypothetical protein